MQNMRKQAHQAQAATNFLGPHNVPISPDVMMCYECLLNSDTLEEYLMRTNPDPTPMSLLSKFLTSSVDSPKDASFEKRHLCLKILATKTIAFFNWDLKMIETELPLQLQYIFLRDLLCLCTMSSDDHNSEFFEPVDHLTIDISSLKDEQIFAMTLYHQWAIHIAIRRSKLPKTIFKRAANHVESVDTIMNKMVREQSISEAVLRRIVEVKKETYSIPTSSSFLPPTEESNFRHDWGQNRVVSARKFYCQIHFDLGEYRIHLDDQIHLAIESLTQCKQLHEEEKLKCGSSGSELFKIDEARLRGLCFACGIYKNEKPSLIIQHYDDVQNSHLNIMDILQSDNAKRELPLETRDLMELDFQARLAKGEIKTTPDSLFQIQTANTIRRVSEGDLFSNTTDYAIEMANSLKIDTVQILIKALKKHVDECSDTALNHIKLFVYSLLKQNTPLTVKDVSFLYTEQEVRTIIKGGYSHIHYPDISKSERHRERHIKQMGNHSLDICMTENQIIKSYNPNDLRMYINRFFSKSGTRPIMSVYNQWKVYPSICQAITSLPNQLLSSYCYVIFAKCMELIKFNNFDVAMELISVASHELKEHKICQLLSWETLYVEMNDLLHNWPALNINRNKLALDCQDCLKKSSCGGDANFLPRPQIRDLCLITLVNIKRDFLDMFSDMKGPTFTYLEFSMALVSACHDLEKFESHKNFAKDAWDLVLPAFYTNNHRTSPNPDRETLTKHSLTFYLTKLRDPCPINVVLSLLSKMYNILRDEKDKDLYFPYTNSWAFLIPISYNSEAIIEVISDVLDGVLPFQPCNSHWLRLRGDVNFARGHHSTAFKIYLETLMSIHDIYSMTSAKSVSDDPLYRRMIKCCSLMGCHIQAAILCQFLVKVDFQTAFKCLSEINSSSHETELYFSFIWEINIFEFLVNFYHKRNEILKRDKVIAIIGSLELNSNNPSDIRSEVMRVRKIRFLAALVKQYITN